MVAPDDVPRLRPAQNRSALSPIWGMDTAPRGLSGLWLGMERSATPAFPFEEDTMSPASATPTEERLFDVAWADGRFVAVGDAGAIIRSSDGDRWTFASETKSRHVTQLRTRSSVASLQGRPFGRMER